MKVASRCSNCGKMFFCEPPVLQCCSKCRQNEEANLTKKRSWTEIEQEAPAPEEKNEERMDAFNCLLCGADFPELVTLTEREEHLELCTRDLEYKSVALSQAICGKELTQEVFDEAENKLSQDGLRGRVFLCVICGVDLSSKGIQTRCNHLKKCAKSHGVSTRDVLQLIAPVDDDPVDTVDDEGDGFNYGDTDGDVDVVFFDGGAGAGAAEAERKEEREESSERLHDSCTTREESSERLHDSCTTREENSEVIDLCTQEDEVGKEEERAPQPKKNAFDVMMSGARPAAAPAPQPKNAFSMMMSGARNLAEAGKQAASSSSSSASAAGQGQKQAAKKEGKGGKGKGKGKGKAANTGSFDYGGMKSRVDAPPGWAPPYKKIMVGDMRVPIVVDGFQFAHPSLSDTYFLTHFHADHYIGLEPDFSCGKIYCTTTTARLVRLRLRLKDPSVLVPLELEREYSVVVAGTEVKVTLCDANHCPGAALILFHFKTGRKVLHTGDFRWDNASMLRQSRLLRSLVAPSPRINSTLGVYLDTTYCDANYAFPPQAQTIAAVVACVERELLAEPSTLFVFGAYQIGKERVWKAVAEALKCRVHVDQTRKKVMSCFSDWSPHSLASLTTSGGEACLWVRPMRDLNFNVLAKLREQRATLSKRPCKRVVAFQPTGWTFSASGSASSSSSSSRSNYRGPGNSSAAPDPAPAAAETAENVLKERRRGPDSIMALPYSEHSSFTELIDFLKTFRPSTVVPTVNTQKEKVKSQLKLLKDGSGIY